MINESKLSSSQREYVLAKDFNLKQNNAQAWLSKNDVENDLTFDLEDFKNGIAIGAADLSETTD